MIQVLWKVTKTIVALADDLQKYNAEIKEVRKELRDLTIIVHALAQDITNSKEQTEQRHEKLLLELENRLLKYEKILPPAKEEKRLARKGAKKGGRK